jgi:diaminohydroxyphosphoribosylaminopyrimidine deaminase/5-amino-6-(5-phosphoribosylamino)uracil reductase
LYGESMEDCDTVHIHYMRHALALARRGLGVSGANPSVGCVIVKNGHIIGRGTTARGGRPHAEAQALAQAGAAQARGADVYVTLEPCAHHGKTPPCAQTLIDAGVTRVFIGCGDPDARVNGRGVEMLKTSGINVFSGICADEAKMAHAGFISRVMERRPFITLKIATTQDGFTVLPPEQGRWITGASARAHAHLMRSQHEAVLAGTGTILADDAMLNVRVPGFAHETIRVVLDGNLRTPAASAVVRSAAQYPLLIMHDAEKTDENGEKLAQSGATLVRCNPHDMPAVLAVLAGRGISRVLVEGGAKVLRSFLDAGLWDEFLWYRAPFSVPQADMPRMPPGQKPLDIGELTQKYGLKSVKTRSLAQDTLEIYRKAQ